MPACQEPDDNDGTQAAHRSVESERRGEEARLGPRRSSSCGSASVDTSASVRSGLQILGLFSQRRPWLRMSEIASATGLSQFEARMQLAAMRRMNLVQEDATSRYGLGPGPPDPTVAIRAMGIVRQTRAHLVELQRVARCPVMLAMLDGTELVVVDRAVAPGSPRLEMTIDLYRRLPAHATAFGKVLLAFQPEHREQELVADLELEPLTPFTITDRQQLLRELQRVRSDGLAIEDREHMAHRLCIAAPVRGAHNRVIAAVGIVIVDSSDPLEELVQSHCEPIAAAASGLSMALRHAEVDGSDLDWPCL